MIPSSRLEMLTNNQLTRTFQKNMQVVQAKDPELYQTIIKNIHLANHRVTPVIVDDKIVNMEISFGHDRKYKLHDEDIGEDELLTLAQTIDHEHSILLYKIGFGQVFLALYALTEKPNMYFDVLKKPIYIVEPSISHFVLFLSLHDLRDVLQSERVFIFLEDIPFTEFNKYLQLPGVRIPKKMVSGIKIPGELFSSCDESEKRTQLSTVVSKRMEDMEEEKNRLLLDVRRYYSERSWETWQAIFSKSPARPPRVLGLTSIYTTFLQYCMRDWLEGFKDYGCETLLHMEPSGTRLFGVIEMLQDLHQFRPDLIILLDHFRYENKGLLPLSIPVVSWIQDLLDEVVDKKGGTIDPLNFVYSFSKTWLSSGIFSGPRFKDCPVDFLSLGINPRIYHPLPDIPKDIDVLYVSHLYHSSRTLHPFRAGVGGEAIWDRYEVLLLADRIITSEQLEMIFKCTARHLDQVNYQDLLYILKDETSNRRFAQGVFSECRIEPNDRLYGLFNQGSVCRLTLDAARIIKAKPLIELADEPITLCIYGKHWDDIVELKRSTKGPTANGSSLNQLMNRARICINNSGGTTMHMRALEILGAGVFMLSRRIPRDMDNADLRDYFVEGEEVIFFDDGPDLKDKVHYYLNHEKEREEIAARAHVKVIDLFSYKNIAAQILDKICNHFGNIQPPGTGSR
ncbi:MAG: glycosyltransferase family 1 protein [Magnetococcales bacterium]|nr:glycosyltransferase family 1 protein [Magnetococcales bacterium]